MFGFGGKIEQFDEVGCKGDAGIVAAQVFPRVGKRGLTQSMEIALRTAADRDLALVEEVESAGEAAFRTQRAFGDGLDFAMRRSEPAYNQTRVAVPRFAEQNGGGGIQEGEKNPGAGGRRVYFIPKNRLQLAEWSAIAATLFTTS